MEGPSSFRITEDLILQITDCSSMDEVLVLSLRNKQLSNFMQSFSLCQNLQIGYFQGNNVTISEMTRFLPNFINLKKIDLSHNHIKQLPDKQIFQSLNNLKFLMLHNNELSSWNDLQNLTGLQKVIYINLSNNPVVTIPGYRHFLVNQVPSLYALDSYIVTDEERTEDASFGYRFRSLNEYMKLHLPDYTTDKSAESHLFNLEVDIYRLRRIYEKNSPSVQIQSLFRGFSARQRLENMFKHRKKMIVLIQRWVRGWLLRKRMKAELRDILKQTNEEHLMMTSKQIQHRWAVMIVAKKIAMKIKRKRQFRLETRAAISMQRVYRSRYVMYSSYVDALQLDRYPSIYFLKEQKYTFCKLIKKIYPYFSDIFNDQEEMEEKTLLNDSRYKTVRITEPDVVNYCYQPLVQLVQPSIKSKVEWNKVDPQWEGKRIHQFMYKNDLNQDETQQQLDILEKRNCSVKKYIKRNQKKLLKDAEFLDQYNDLIEFRAVGSKMASKMVQEILTYNRTQGREQQMLIPYFRVALDKVCAATRIQQYYRLYRFRLNQRSFMVDWIVKKRAAICVQRAWSDIRLKERMKGLVAINKHLVGVDEPDIYIEEHVYMNIGTILTYMRAQRKFYEQNISYDFNHNREIGAVQMERNNERYQRYTLPDWMQTRLPQFKDYSPSLYYNNIMAFFHFLPNSQCGSSPEVKTYTSIIDLAKKKIDYRFDMKFIKIPCGSVDEAKRRAAVLALMTYDLKTTRFVKIFSKSQLEDPFFITNIRQIAKDYQILYEPSYENAASTTQKQSQKHMGLILSSKDRNLVQGYFRKIKIYGRTEIILNETEGQSQMKSPQRFKQSLHFDKVPRIDDSAMSLNKSKTSSLSNLGQSSPILNSQKFQAKLNQQSPINRYPSDKGGGEDNEIVIHQTQSTKDGIDIPMIGEEDSESAILQPKNISPLAVQRKKNPSFELGAITVGAFQPISNTTVSKSRLQENLRQGADELRNQKRVQKFIKTNKEELELEERKTEVVKQNEIKKIIKTEHEYENQRNVQMFQILNYEEKNLRKELIDKQNEAEKRQKQINRVSILTQAKHQAMKKNEEKKFYNSFRQAKNIIEKQIMIGKQMRRKTEEITDNKNKIVELKKSNQGAKQIQRDVVKGTNLYESHPTAPKSAVIFNKSVRHSDYQDYMKQHANMTQASFANQSAIEGFGEGYTTQGILGNSTMYQMKRDSDSPFKSQRLASRQTNGDMVRIGSGQPYSRNYVGFRAKQASNLPPLQSDKKISGSKSTKANMANMTHYSALHDSLNKQNLEESFNGLINRSFNAQKRTLPKPSFLKSGAVFCEENYPIGDISTEQSLLYQSQQRYGKSSRNNNASMGGLNISTGETQQSTFGLPQKIMQSMNTFKKSVKNPYVALI